MWIESIIRRKAGTRVSLRTGYYHFISRSPEDPRHVDWVESDEHQEILLAIPEGYRIAEGYGEGVSAQGLHDGGSPSVPDDEPDEHDEPEIGTRAWLDKATKKAMLEALEMEGLELPNARWNKAETKSYVEAVLQIGAD